MDKHKLLRFLKSFGIYYSIELVFDGLLVAYLLWIFNLYTVSDSMYQLPIIGMVIATIITFKIILGASIGKVMACLLTAIVSIYLIAQDIYHDAFHSYYRLKTAIGLKDELLGVKDSVMEFLMINDFIPLMLLILLLIIFLVIFIFFQRKYIKLVFTLPLRFLAIIPLFVIFNQYHYFNQILIDSKNSQDYFQVFNTDYYIYTSMPDVTMFVDKFGLLTLGYKDSMDIFQQNQDLNDYGQQITSYLDLKDSSVQSNEFTGIFKDKNILFIQAESYNLFALDPALTPTLYKMLNNSINVVGFDTPALPGSTSDTEFMVNTSLIPKTDGEAACYQYVNNTYPTTLPTLFKQNGYATLAIHNNYESYYNRGHLFLNLGYDQFLDCTDLVVSDGSADSELMDKLKYIIADATDYKLMMYWITYSGHQPYDYSSVGVSESNVNKILKKYPNLDEKYVSYLAKNMDLDQALAQLIQQCKYTNALDDLVIVFFGDHVAKNISLSESNDYFAATNKEYIYDFNDTCLYIYNPLLNKTEYSKVSTALDILPTIANLFGFEYDAKTILGRDVFDPNYKGFYFSNWGEYKNDLFSYDAVNDIYDIKDDSLSKEKVLEIVQDMMDEILVSKYILKTDYFANVKFLK